jgi:hypothetical protein
MDWYARDPVGVDVAEASAGRDTLGSLQGADQNAIGGEEIRDGGSLRKEFGVGQDVEVAVGL